ncbi:hypothetical protein AAFF_G00372550 [Aldrovandia affinis]|uniref:Uncharacterized protein n=1 Tax=Aldrovandia affinis TaxID=143900 RepID=A0AAD7SGA1_9TELE|nr:hypothetical protein AAFF_G00372550 [Aldrovandia affinis]
MTAKCVLQLCVWLAGLCVARPPSPTQGPAPAAQVSVLSHGLLHLLSGMEENGRYLERQGRQVGQELQRRARELSRLRRRARRVDRLWAGLKRELQVWAARGEGLQRGAAALQDLAGWDALEHRLARIQEIVQVLTVPGVAANTATPSRAPLNITLLQNVIEAQARRLADLTLEVMIQDGLMTQQDQRIAQLQMSDTREELQGIF